MAARLILIYLVGKDNIITVISDLPETFLTISDVLNKDVRKALNSAREVLMFFIDRCGFIFYLEWNAHRVLPALTLQQHTHESQEATHTQSTDAGLDRDNSNSNHFSSGEHLPAGRGHRHQGTQGGCDLNNAELLQIHHFPEEYGPKHHTWSLRPGL